MNVMFPVMLGPTWLPMSYNPSVASSPSGHLNGWVSPETAASAAEAVAGPGETPARSRAGHSQKIYLDIGLKQTADGVAATLCKTTCHASLSHTHKSFLRVQTSCLRAPLSQIHKHLMLPPK
jgi:hypothetical protein